MSSNGPQFVDGHDIASSGSVVADTATTDVGSALNDFVHGLGGPDAGAGSEGLNPAAAHSVGDIVAAIASFDPGNPLGALDHLALDPGVGGADTLHVASHVDLSDVGSVLSHAGGDIASSHLDLDHLTSNLNLFDMGHVDAGADGGHHT